MKRLIESQAEGDGQLSAPLPLVIDLGKLKRKEAKRLKRMERLPAEVARAVEEVRERLGVEAEGKTLLPVVVLFEKKPKKRKRALGLF